MARARAVTSTDVARRAGVSQATVSVVLNGTRSTSRVSDATRRRVLAAAAELDYAPHPAAQALRRQRSGVIAFVPEARRGPLAEHPVSHQLSVQIAAAAIRRGYHVVEANAEPASARASDKLVGFLASRRVDGVIFYAPGTAAEVRRVVERGLPVVQLLRPQIAAATPAITVDAALGIAAAVDHLVGLGHRRIAFLGHGGPHPIDRARREGFAAALARHGLPLPGEWVRAVASYAIEEGRRAVHALLALPARPTALFAASDTLALGALHALHEARLRAPDNLSLVSYDDVFAAQLPPPLSCVVQPLEEVAEGAVAILAARLERPEGCAGAEGLVLPTRFVARGSTQAPPRDAPAA